MTTDIEGLVNIGPALARDLHAVGIHDVADLRSLGALEAARRLEAAGRRDCVNAFLAIEGALRGRRWISMPPEERRRLREEWNRR